MSQTVQLDIITLCEANFVSKHLHDRNTFFFARLRSIALSDITAVYQDQISCLLYVASREQPQLVTSLEVHPRHEHLQRFLPCVHNDVDDLYLRRVARADVVFPIQ